MNAWEGIRLIFEGLGLTLFGFLIVSAISDLKRVGYEVYKLQTKSDSKVYCDGTFEDFLNFFNEREWKRDINYPKSYFPKNKINREDYIHAGIIKFDNVGFIMNYEEWKKFTKWEKDNLYCDKE